MSIQPFSPDAPVDISESEHRDLLGQLADAERAVEDRGLRQTLAPHRTHPTSLATLGRTILSEQRLRPPAKVRLVRGLIEIDTATYENFPENIFWDLDALIGSAIRQCIDHSVDGPDFAERLVTRITGLQALFGQRSIIRFRYAHDFLYGFDWARWVKKAPEARASLGPFDLAFLDALEARGRELLDLIERGDTKYPPLSDDVARNPFSFSRDVEQERTLHRDLANLGHIPVCAWESAPQLDWRADFSAKRRERAMALCIDKPETHR